MRHTLEARAGSPPTPVRTLVPGYIPVPECLTGASWLGAVELVIGDDLLDLPARYRGSVGLVDAGAPT